MGSGGGSGWWGVRVDVNEELKFLGKFKKKNLWGGSGGGGSGHRGRVGKGVGVRVDVNEELKFLGKFKKKIWVGGSGSVWGGGVGLGGGSGWM